MKKFLKKLLKKLGFHFFHKKNKYGHKRQKHDHRDFKYSECRPETEAERAIVLPPSINLQSYLPGCWDQGKIGSCTAHGIGAALVSSEKTQEQVFEMPSRLFIYWNERDMEGTVDQDCGAAIRDGIKTVATLGSASEDIWPYDQSKFKEKPPQGAYDCANTNKVLSYMALDNTNLEELKSCLAAGYPFVFGFAVFKDFESARMARIGVLTLPNPSDKPVGGHCVLAVGYDDDSQTFLIRNSWGQRWGRLGHFTMPYAYVTNPQLAFDFWTIRTSM